MAKLTITSPEFLGQFCELPDGRFSIGRAPRNMLIISDSSVSADHCELLINGNEVILRECGSRNGTFVNGNRLQSQCQVKHGQIIRLGNVEARLELEGEIEDQSFTSVTAFSALKAATRELPEPKKPEFPIRFTPYGGADSSGATMMMTKAAVRPPPTPVEPSDLAPQPAPPPPKPALKTPAKPVVKPNTKVVEEEEDDRTGGRGIFVAIAVVLLLAMIWFLVR